MKRCETVGHGSGSPRTETVTEIPPKRELVSTSITNDRGDYLFIENKPYPFKDLSVLNKRKKYGRNIFYMMVFYSIFNL